MKILVTDPIAPKGIELLKKEFEVDVMPEISYEELLNIVGNYDAIVTRSRTPVTTELLEKAINLKVIGRAGVGVDNVDIQTASKKGILVCNTPGANTIGATELTIGHMINIIRTIHKTHNTIMDYRWERHSFMGTELFGKTLGIIGLGNIGSQISIRAKAFGMKVLAYDPYIPREKGDRLGVKLYDDLDEMLAVSDIITIHTPLTHETKGMINKERIAKMKNGAIVINCARGGIIVEWDLVEALKSGKLYGAGIDVFSKEPPPKELVDAFRECKNVSLSAHIGANTYESQENVGIIIAEQVTKALKGLPVDYLVNAPFPDISVITLLKPHLDLAENMGSLAAQLTNEGIKKIKVEVMGDLAKNSKPIVSAVLKGVLKTMIDYPVNIINSTYLAKDYGIEVEEVAKEDSEDFKHYIKVIAYGDVQEKVVGGSLIENHIPRILQIDKFFVDVEPEGVMLIFENKDMPGVIGTIGSILGQANVNIAGFRLGREKKGGIALGVLNLDAKVSDDVLEKLKRIPQIISMKQVIL